LAVSGSAENKRKRKESGVGLETKRNETRRAKHGRAHTEATLFDLDLGDFDIVLVAILEFVFAWFED
jgi:hypothetical protein